MSDRPRTSRIAVARARAAAAKVAAIAAVCTLTLRRLARIGSLAPAAGDS